MCMIEILMETLMNLFPFYSIILNKYVAIFDVRRSEETHKDSS